MQYSYQLTPAQTHTRRYVEGDIFGANVVKHTSTRTHTRYVCDTLVDLRARLSWLNSSAVQDGNIGERVSVDSQVTKRGKYWIIDVRRTVDIYVLDG